MNQASSGTREEDLGGAEGVCGGRGEQECRRNPDNANPKAESTGGEDGTTTTQI